MKNHMEKYRKYTRPEFLQTRIKNIKKL